MKKYRQLVLTVVAVLSLVLFLKYRHEYNRLHYVLEVFNFFGQPCNFTDLIQSTNIINHYDWGPVPQWQQYDDTNFYSGFWFENEAKVIATKNDPVRTRSCYLWYEDKTTPLPGKFKYSTFGREIMTGTTGYIYHCRALKSEQHIPYAVSFYTNDKLKILLNTNDSNNTRFNTTVCVSSSKQMSKRSFIEFLSYHNLIGIDSFIFYTSDVSYKLSKFVTNLSRRLEIEFTIYPWNYPKTDDFLTRSIVETDCNMRAKRHSNYVLTLDVNEYIVPSVYTSIKSVFDEYGSQSERLSLPVQVICVNNIDKQKPVALQNNIIYYSNDNKVRDVYRSTENKNIISTQIIEDKFAHILKYENCTVSDKKYTDNSIQKFATDFIRSTLYQLWIHGQI